MKKLITIILIAAVFACSPKNELKSRIIGVWVLEETVDDVGDLGFNLPVTSSDQTEESKQTNAETSLQFFEDNSLILIQKGNKTSVTFSIEDSTLTLGNRQYKILELGENSLRLRDESSFIQEEQIYRKK